MINIARQYAKLPPEKRALFKQLLRTQGIDLSTVILPVDRAGDAFPLSFAQQRMWFLYQLDPDSPYYNIPSTYRMTGLLDLACLEACLGEIIARHESLRTVFALRDGEPHQIIRPAIPLPLQLVDLTGLPAEQREAEAARLAQAEALKPFDLANGPLIRVVVWRLRPDEHLAAITFHHIAADGWSMNILIGELMALYGRRSGLAIPLPELDIQYVDYAVWQRDCLTGPALDGLVQYWKNQLAGAPPLLELPTDHPRPASQSFRGSYLPLTLAADLSAQLQALARQEGVSLFMLLLAAFQTLLYRYTGQPDISVGSPVANRSRADLEPLIGFFVNTLVLRSDLAGDHLTFRELLGRVKETCLGAYAHQELPFEQVVEALHLEHNMSYNPLFQVMFVLQNASRAEQSLPGLTIQPVEVPLTTAKFDLTLTLREEPQGLTGGFEYATDLFEPETIARLQANWVTLLRGLAAHPDTPITRLPLLAPAEHRLLLETWNQTAAPVPTDRCAYQLFEDWARSTPTAPALEFEGRPMTFAALNQRANQIAHHLHSLGLQPEERVGLCLQRSPEMIAAILGVQKAGGAYVPLDPAYPADRLAFMIQDAGLRRVLGHPATAGLLTELGLSEPWIDLIGPEIDRQPGSNLDLPAEPDRLAYVIYTSGSTGQPKGVLLEHRGLTNMAVAYARYMGLGPGMRILQFFSYNFDASVADIFTPLVSGGTICTGGRETLLPGPELTRFMRDQRVTHAVLTPSALAALPPTELPDLHVLLFGGEAMTRQILEPWTAPTRRMINVYGPTEVTVISTLYEVTDLASEPSGIPIGKPFPNLTAYILDPQFNPVPLEVIGELYVGGVGVGRGYLNRPQLTADRFLPDPFSTHPAARMYKTGDLVRWRADGNIEYLGRGDGQVKIRGFRVELGEIETQLLQIQGIKQAAVFAVEQDHIGQSLAAYYTPIPGHEPPSPAEILARLRPNLPAYMLPAHFIRLDSLPLTHNGKIDRRALPVPAAGPTVAVVYRAPRTPVEQGLADIWRQVLGTEQTGLDDHFFELGGHSLKAAQLTARLRSVFQIEYPLRAVLDNPSLNEMALQVEALMAGRPNTPAADRLAAVPPAQRPARIPLSFAQQRLWFIEQMDPGGSTYNIPLALRLRGPLDLDALQSSLNGVIARHEALRTAFREADGVAYQAVLPPYPMPIIQLDLSCLPEHQKEIKSRQLILKETLRPFNLGAVPLLRTTLLRLGPEDHIFILVMHHIISDGWSMGVMAGEIMARYAEYQQSTPGASRPAVQPADLPLQYADYAIWQRGWLQGEALQDQINYWKTQLAGLPPQLDLPTDRPRPTMQTNHGANLAVRLTPEITTRLKALCQQEGVTLYMALLAVFQTLLFRWTNQDDFALGTPVANRGRAEIEPLIGFFVNTLVLRADLADPAPDQALDFITLLRRVRETCLGAYAHQELPFEALVEALQPERSTSRSPLFQVMFMLQNNSVPSQGFPNLSTEWLDLDPGTSMFDLTLVLEEAAGGLTGGFEYNTDLFDRETIARMAEHFTILLDGALANPAQPVRRLPLMSEAERRRVVFDWNQTQRAWPQLAFCAHQLFEQQAARTPDAPAVYSPAEDLTLSYAQLDAKANRLAHSLCQAGVIPGSRVAACLERSTDAIISLLAILKAGGAYLPIDPAYPAERIQFMLEDSQARLVLTRASLAPNLPDCGARVLCLDSEAERISRQPAGRLDLPAAPDDVAYIIYTSGSTGRPKGVLVEHHALVNHNLAVTEIFQLTPADRMLQFASLSFDTSLEEIFPTLINGAELVIRPSGDLPSGAQLNQWAETWGLTILDLPTAYWHAWVSEISLGQPAPLAESIRLVVVGGEKAHAEKLAAWRERVDPRIAWFDGYGPTEAAIIATGYIPPSHLPGGPLPIGRPLPNDRTYVLDPLLQPVPIGVAGELFIAGEGVARGYLNRPELTAERFLPDPFIPGARMYRTGDLARWISAGDEPGLLEYRGRVDFQVKIRGFRVEPGEVETALRQMPAVQQAVVIPRETGAALQLVAYLIPADPLEKPAAAALRAFLKDRLPDYMVPAAFVWLDQLPLTPSGKVDRRALPEPTAERPEQAGALRLPGTPAEQTLVDVWQQVLGRDPIGIDDNFFALGGDSILSLQVVARANQAGLALTPRLLFEHPTVAELAAAAGSAAPRIPAEQGPVTGPYPLTPIQHWFFNLNLPNPEHWNQSLLLALPEPPDPAHLDQALLALINHHDVLRSSFAQNETGVWQAEIHPPLLGLPPRQLRDLSTLTPDLQDTALTAACADLQAGFRLDQPPLITAGLFWLGPARGARLLVAAHHLVVDGVSWRVLLEDLAAALAQLQQGQPVTLPPKSAAYSQWAAGLPEAAQAAAVLDELPTWLPDETPAPLPVDHPVPYGGEWATAALAFSLDEHETDILLKQAPTGLRTSAEGLMLAALGWALRQWAGPQIMSIDLEHHGRTDLLPLDISRTVGWFTADFPLCLNLRQAASPLDCLRLVKEKLHDIRGDGFGFGLLAAYHPDPAVRRQLNQLAYPQISFNYLGQFSQAQQAGGLTIADENRGPERGLRNPSSTLIDINGSVFDNQLRLEFTYSPTVHEPQTIQRLVEVFAAALRSYLHPEDERLQAEALTHVDFPLANLDQKKLKKVLEKFNQSRGRASK